MNRPTWDRLRTGRHPVSSVSIGPFRLIARRDSFTLASCLSGPVVPTIDVPAKNESEARKAVIDAARAKLADWAAELDALEHQEPR